MPRCRFSSHPAAGALPCIVSQFKVYYFPALRTIAENNKFFSLTRSFLSRGVPAFLSFV